MQRLRLCLSLLSLLLAVTSSEPAPQGPHPPEPPANLIYHYGAGLSELLQDQEATGSTLVSSYVMPEDPSALPVHQHPPRGLLHRHGGERPAPEETAANALLRPAQPDEIQSRRSNRLRPRPNRKRKGASSDWPMLDFAEEVMRRYRSLGCANLWRGDPRPETLQRCAAASAQTYVQQLKMEETAMARRGGHPADDTEDVDADHGGVASQEVPKSPLQQKSITGSEVLNVDPALAQVSGGLVRSPRVVRDIEDSEEVEHQQEQPKEAPQLDRPLTEREARKLNWTIWADFVDPHILNHRLGGKSSSNSVNVDSKYEATTTHRYRPWAPTVDDYDASLYRRRSAPGSAGDGDSSPTLSASKPVQGSVHKYEYRNGGSGKYRQSGAASSPVSYYKNAPGSSTPLKSAREPSKRASAGSASTSHRQAAVPAKAPIATGQDPFVPPHLREDFPYDIRVINTKHVKLAPPKDGNGMEMRPGPLALQDLKRNPQRPNQASSPLLPRVTQRLARPLEPLRPSKPTTSRLGSTRYGFLGNFVTFESIINLMALTLAGFGLMAYFALVVHNAVLSDTNGFPSTGREASGEQPATSEELLDVLKTVEAAVYPDEADCLHWQLCTLASRRDWRPLPSIVGAALAWSSSSLGSGDRMENLRAVAAGSRNGDCDIFPKCQ